jgi:hypothetical protein
MKTIQITISDEEAALVEQLLAEGHWGSVEDLFLHVLHQAVDEINSKTPDDVVEAVRLGLAQAQRGELVDGQAVIDRCLAKLEAAKHSRS